MAKDHNAEDLEHLNAGDGVQAYQTLVDWVKSVPNVIQEIEEKIKILQNKQLNI